MLHQWIKAVVLCSFLAQAALLSQCALPNEGDEVWVNANLVHVRIQGKWEAFPLIPLAEHLCEHPDELFRKHCKDRVVAPTPQFAAATAY